MTCSWACAMTSLQRKLISTPSTPSVWWQSHSCCHISLNHVSSIMLDVTPRDNVQADPFLCGSTGNVGRVESSNSTEANQFQSSKHSRSCKAPNTSISISNKSELYDTVMSEGKKGRRGRERWRRTRAGQVTRAVWVWLSRWQINRGKRGQVSVHYCVRVV